MFYERLSLLCARENIKISMIAQHVLDVNASTATGWKKGASPNSVVVVKAARYFGVSADYLLGLSDRPCAPHDPENLADETLGALKLLENASPEARSVALQVMQAAIHAIDGQAAHERDKEDALAQEVN